MSRLTKKVDEPIISKHLHYIKVPENFIVIDIDINKKGIHLHYIKEKGIHLHYIKEKEGK